MTQFPLSDSAKSKFVVSPDENGMRHLEVPIICRIADDELLLDLRTIPEKEFIYKYI